MSQTDTEMLKWMDALLEMDPDDLELIEVTEAQDDDFDGDAPDEENVSDKDKVEEK